MASESIREVQLALKSKGFDPGEIDGVWGRNTIRAVKEFQAQQGLGVDGIVGPKTRAALLGGAATAGTSANTSASSTIVLPWYEEAKHLIGVRERAGSASSAVIMDWADDLDIHYPGDDVAWCGLFVAHCISSTLPDETIPKNPLGARQWEKFGDPTNPRLGAVMVFWRKAKSSGFGHVGFYAGEDGDAYQILGGNQSDQVSLAWVGKNRFLGARWPTSAASLASATVIKGRQEGLSDNEA